jgi:ubiquitin-conjugating enzyme E2 G1
MMARPTAAEETLRNQFREVQNDSTSGFSAGLVHDDIFRWRVTLIGPPRSAYEGGVFPILIEFPHEFPNSPPQMRFLCPMYHPNVRETGEICISILHPPNGQESDVDVWGTARSAAALLMFLISAMIDPGFDAPENLEAARTYATDRQTFMRKVRRTVDTSNEFVAF